MARFNDGRGSSMNKNSGVKSSEVPELHGHDLDQGAQGANPHPGIEDFSRQYKETISAILGIVVAMTVAIVPAIPAIMNPNGGVNVIILSIILAVLVLLVYLGALLFSAWRRTNRAMFAEQRLLAAERALAELERANKIANDRIRELSVERQKFDRKMISAIVDVQTPGGRTKEELRRDVKRAIEEYLTEICRTSSIIISLRSSGHESACAANIKVICLGSYKIDPRYRLYAHYGFSSGRQNYEESKKSGRLVQKNEVYSHILSEQSEDIYVENEAEKIYGDTKISEIEPNSLMVSGNLNSFITTGIIGEVYSIPFGKEMADKRTSVPLNSRQVLGFLCVDSLNIKFDKDFDGSIVAEMANYAYSALRMFDCVTALIEAGDISALMYGKKAPRGRQIT